MSEEVWKQIPSVEIGYEASTHGRIRSLRMGAPHVLATKRTAPPSYLYLGVTLWSHQVRRCAKVHALIAEAFIGPRPPGMQINHIDGNGKNNRPENLEYVTASQNNLHKCRVLGRGIGEGNPHARATEALVLQIREMAKTMKKSEIARSVGLSHCAVTHIVNRTRWAHVQAAEKAGGGA